MKEQKKKKGNRKASIEKGEEEEFLTRELYKTIIELLKEIKDKPIKRLKKEQIIEQSSLKTEELQYILLKKKILTRLGDDKKPRLTKLGKDKNRFNYLDSYRERFLISNYSPQNLCNHLSTLASGRWKILKKDKEGYRLTKKGLALVENYGKEWVINSFKELLDHHPLKTARLTFGISKFLVLGFDEKELKPEDCNKIKNHIKEIESSAMKIEGILTKAKYNHFISIVTHIYPDYEEWLEEAEKKRDPKGYERRKKKLEKYIKAGKIPWYILKEKQSDKEVDLNENIG